MFSPAACRPLCVSFSPQTGAAVTTGLPVLRGPDTEALFPQVRASGQTGAWQLFHGGDWLVGGTSVLADAGLAVKTEALYGQILSASGGWSLARIWHYVPAINQPGPDGLENYRAFSQGRAQAFEAALGRDFTRHLPAASAVGTDARELTVVFAATTLPVRHVENPRQTPAYEYPPLYGPRPPSFARATIVGSAECPAAVFISGTAAVRGHASVAPSATLPQLENTLENLRSISQACGLGPALGAGRAASRHFKVYLRHAADLPMVAEVLEAQLWRPTDTVSYLRSDICRRELTVEIEASVFGVRPA